MLSLSVGVKQQTQRFLPLLHPCDTTGNDSFFCCCCVVFVAHETRRDSSSRSQCDYHARRAHTPPIRSIACSAHNNAAIHMKTNKIRTRVQRTRDYFPVLLCVRLLTACILPSARAHTNTVAIATLSWFVSVVDADVVNKIDRNSVYHAKYTDDERSTHTQQATPYV